MPIFILGMPRSGTTLVEQILASHPQVFGAGELTVLTDLVNATSPEVSTQKYPECVADFDAEMLASMGSDYVDKVRGYSEDADHIIDKMPQNFIYVGLIVAIFVATIAIRFTLGRSIFCGSLFGCQGRMFYALDEVSHSRLLFCILRG